MSEEAPAAKATILIYSDDRRTRDQIKVALGRRVAADVPELTMVECATHQAAIKTLDEGGIDLVIADGEAVPLGGMGLCRQAKDEVPGCPPFLLLVERVADAWLATWSRACPTRSTRSGCRPPSPSCCVSAWGSRRTSREPDLA